MMHRLAALVGGGGGGGGGKEGGREGSEQLPEILITSQLAT